MIISIEMTDKMLADFFDNAGFETTMISIPDWRAVGHTEMKEYQRDVLHVVTRHGQKLPAKEVFEKVMMLRATRPDQVTINQLKSLLNND